MDPKLFATVFVTVFLAEMGDKTQLATMLFAADAKNGKWTVLAASSLALCAVAAIGVVAGKVVGETVSPRTLKWVAGIGFVAIGAWTIWKA
jgi:putative Ca2+/H+ antiporter (TMEM165/GDT1 family)